MNALRIVLAQLARRPLQTVLAIVLLALGVATLTFVVLVQGQLSKQLARDAQGIDLVVGAKGSPLQLILSALYHVDVPTGNVPLAAMDQLRRNRLVAQVIPVGQRGGSPMSAHGRSEALIPERAARRVVQ